MAFISIPFIGRHQDDFFMASDRVAQTEANFKPHFKVR
jgi:hypothetical protein